MGLLCKTSMTRWWGKEGDDRVSAHCLYCVSTTESRVDVLSTVKQGKLSLPNCDSDEILVAT